MIPTRASGGRFGCLGGAFGESCGRLKAETRTKVDEDVAKGRGDENRQKRGEGDRPEYADALRNIHILLMFCIAIFGLF